MAVVAAFVVLAVVVWGSGSGSGGSSRSRSSNGRQLRPHSSNLTLVNEIAIDPPIRTIPSMPMKRKDPQTRQL